MATSKRRHISYTKTKTKDDMLRQPRKTNENGKKRKVLEELNSKSQKNNCKQLTLLHFAKSPQNVIQETPKNMKKKRKVEPKKPLRMDSKSKEDSPLMQWIRTNSPLKSSPIKKAKKKCIKRYSSDSFDRYGVNLPSLEYILDYQKQFEEFKKCLDNIDFDSDIAKEVVDFSLDEPEVPVEVLDCKHLTNKQLKKSLVKNYQFVHDIFHGITMSDRHDRFQNEDVRNRFTDRDLTYNTSMITFTFEQKELMLNFLSEKFDHSENQTHTQYFFKVLLPELCTKIFMDTHNMSYVEATKYLSTRPVD